MNENICFGPSYFGNNKVFVPPKMIATNALEIKALSKHMINPPFNGLSKFVLCQELLFNRRTKATENVF
jgi:hypothetical protein